jgi:hypothetical protein
MHGNFRRPAVHLAFLALLLATTATASAGTYTQALTVTDLNYTVQDLDLNDGIDAAYSVYKHGHGVAALSTIRDHAYESTIDVSTFRPKPLAASFEFPGVDAAASNNGRGGSQLATNLTLDMAEYQAGQGVRVFSDLTDNLTIAAHSVVTVTVNYEYAWLYDGELGPEIAGQVTQKFELYGGVYLNADFYELSRWNNGSGSDAGTLAIRIENRSAGSISYDVNFLARTGMRRVDWYTPGEPLPDPAPVPEPATVGMLLGGLPLVLLALRRRCSKAGRTARQFQ